MKRAAALVGIGVVLACLVAGGFLLYLFVRYNVGNGNNAQMNKIEASVNAVQFSSPIEKRQCGSGGIDTSEWCTYVVKAPLAAVEEDLKAAGYMLKDPGYSNKTYVGGDPQTTIYLTETDGMTTGLEAKILKNGRTI